MSGIALAMFMNQRSFFVEPAIGDAYEGGFYAGLFSVDGNGVATHRLVVASKAVGEFYSNIWGSSITTGATSISNGASNTTAMAGASALGASCANLVTGGYDDWYMPAQKEMEQLYFYFKPGISGNNSTVRGGNSFAVPQRSNYTESIPPQTPLTAWRTNGAQAFSTATDGNYWDSTETSSSKAIRRSFSTGYYIRGYPSLGLFKTNQGLTRAIRKVAI